jgi:hypothetical protein
MKILLKVVILGFAILLFGCSKKVETVEPSNAATDNKLSVKNVGKEKVKQSNITNLTFDFKGVKIGMSQDEVKTIFPKLPKLAGFMGCEEGTNLTCKDKVTLINETPDMVSCTFANGKLDDVSIIFDNKIFKDLFYGLKSKYGEPNELIEPNSKDKLKDLAKRIDESVPLAVFWESVNGERITIANVSSASVEGLSKGFYQFQSRERVVKLNKEVESDKQREKLKRKDL